MSVPLPIHYAPLPATTEQVRRESDTLGLRPMFSLTRLPNVGVNEVLALEQQRQIQRFRGCIGKQISEIEIGTSALTVAITGKAGKPRDLFIDRHDFNSSGMQEAL